MSGGHETGGELRVVDVARKRAAVVGHILFLSILCPFFAIPFFGTMMKESDETAYAEASLDGSGGH